MPPFLLFFYVRKLKLVAASSIGIDAVCAFLSKSTIDVDYGFFDGGQFAQIRKAARSVMVPFLYLAIKSLCWSKGKTLKKILWCDDEGIKPYFIKAGEALTYGNLRRQLGDSLENRPFPHFLTLREENSYFEFGSIEDHYRHRASVMKAYPKAIFPVFRDYNHMQYQIRDPRGFATMLESVMNGNGMSPLSFLEWRK